MRWLLVFGVRYRQSAADPFAVERQRCQSWPRSNADLELELSPLLPARPFLACETAEQRGGGG